MQTTFRQHNSKTRHLLEGGEVAIPGYQWNLVIEAALGDEGVGKFGVEPLAQKLGTQPSGALPVSRCYFQYLDFED